MTFYFIFIWLCYTITTSAKTTGGSCIALRTSVTDLWCDQNCFGWPPGPQVVHVACLPDTLTAHRTCDCGPASATTTSGSELTTLPSPTTTTGGSELTTLSASTTMTGGEFTTPASTTITGGSCISLRTSVTNLWCDQNCFGNPPGSQVIHVACLPETLPEHRTCNCGPASATTTSGSELTTSGPRTTSGSPLTTSGPRTTSGSELTTSASTTIAGGELTTLSASTTITGGSCISLRASVTNLWCDQNCFGNPRGSHVVHVACLPDTLPEDRTCNCGPAPTTTTGGNELTTLPSPSDPYYLVNLDTGLTETEANDYCKSNYGTTLATINTQSDYDIARSIIDNGTPREPPLIGLVNRKDKTAWFTWNSGDICAEPAYGACVPAEFWITKKPINCKEHCVSDCVTFYNNGFNNNKPCNKRRTFLCNGNLYPNLYPNVAAFIIPNNNIDGENKFDVVEYVSSLSWIYIILGLVAICNVIIFIYCCHAKYCRNKIKKGNKTYDKVTDDDEAELMGNV